jgi:hypothetical protein
MKLDKQINLKDLLKWKKKTIKTDGGWNHKKINSKNDLK